MELQALSLRMKVVLGVLVGLIAIATVLLVSSNIALLMARQHDGELHLFSVFSQLASPDPKHVKYAKLGLMAGLGLVGFAVVAIIKKTGMRALHGRARWASESEIKQAGLRDTQGIICGKYRGQYMMFGGTEHVMVYAPTRSGKGGCNPARHKTFQALP